MTGERWQRIEALFGHAVELPATERESFVAASCADDSTLRDEVLDLLAADGREQLHELVGSAASELVRDSAAARLGHRIGPYRLVELLGHGGMGSVYRAERDDGEFHRTVAIKLLDGGTGNRAAARFRDERQILARLAHPNIVRLIDGGTTDDGTPYLVMDHVAGVPITTFARDLSVERCVELAIEVCKALDYAHGLGVIHRDIKPSNILVGAGGPQLLDFGIAKLVDPTTEREAETRTGVVLLTPEYASPEQARGEPVTAATDIYSLGAVLYELVAHRRPLVLDGNMLDILRVISEVEPPKPSAVAPPGRAIFRDLDRIVLGALRKQPGERYRSAAVLAADLEAYLAGKAVSPPRSRGRRSRWLLGAAGAVVVATAAIVVALRPHPWLSAGDHALAIHVTGDPQLARAAARMAARALRTRERRFVIVDDARAADVTAELAIHREGDAIVLGGELVASGQVSLPEARGRSVEAAISILVPAIGDAVGGDHPPREPDATERAAMERIGARTFEDYRAWIEISDIEFRTTETPLDDVREQLEALVARDPGWAHPWALITGTANDGLRFVDNGKPAIARARAALGTTTRDPAGRAVLEAQQLIAQNDAAAAARLLEPFATANPDDQLVAIWLHNAYDLGHRTDEDVAQLRRMHEQRPDLQWGADLIGALRRIGRGAEIEPLVRAWLARAPDSEQATISMIGVELDGHRTEAALQRMRDLLVLRDDAPHRLVLLCDLLILADRTHDAAQVADKLLHGSTLNRAKGLQRLATIEILEGRFAAALQTLLPTGPDAAELGRMGQLLEIGHDLAVALGSQDLVQRFDDALDGRHTDYDDSIGSRQRRFERALLAGQCPSVDGMLDEVRWPIFEATRADGRRWLMRAAAERGCVPCREVIRVGVVAAETDLRSAFRFAACAEVEGELALAADTFGWLRDVRLQAVDQTYSTAPFVWIMARYRHARVLERLGRTDEARREYQDFLAHWGHADYPLPELAAARAALEHLPK